MVHNITLKQMNFINNYSSQNEIFDSSNLKEILELNKKMHFKLVGFF
jgi:hypothetical protein